MWTAIEQVSPETELDTLMTAGTASPQPSLLQQDWVDLGGEQSRKGSSSKGWQGWEQTPPLALGEGDKVEHGSDDRNHVLFPLYLQYPAQSPEHSNPS